MNFRLFHAWNAFLAAQPRVSSSRPLPNMRAHYAGAIAAHIEMERHDINQKREDDHYEYDEDSDEDERWWVAPPTPLQPFDFDKVKDYDTSTFELINRCRRPGLYEFLTSITHDAKAELRIRSIMHFMSNSSDASLTFTAVSTALKQVEGAYYFEDGTDLSLLDEEVSRGVRAAIQFLIEHHQLGVIAPLITEPIMRDPECAPQVAEYVGIYFSNPMDASGFDLERLHDFLESPSPALASGTL